MRFRSSGVVLAAALAAVVVSVPRHAGGLDCYQPVGETAPLVLEQVTEDGVAVDAAAYGDHAVEIRKYDRESVVRVDYQSADGSGWLEEYR
jgi:hypothetical protein